MSLSGIKALTFDTGGTILDWHSGFSAALAEAGAKHGQEKNWAAVTNEMRRLSLKRVVNLGEHEPPATNFDDAHRDALDEALEKNGLDMFTADDRRKIWWDAAHSFKCWPDFPAVLPKLRETYICASFTLLSVRIIVDTGRRNGLSWDTVISCEAIGKYKVLPAAYQTAAKLLQFDPGEICMVACHNFDLNAAKAAGFKTAFVRRPDEWGPEGSPDPTPNPEHNVIVDTFPELARELGVSV